LDFFSHFSVKEKDEARPDPPVADWDSLNAFILRFAGVKAFCFKDEVRRSKCGLPQFLHTLNFTLRTSPRAGLSNPKTVPPLAEQIERSVMKKVQLFALAFAGFVVSSHAEIGFADSVISYDPGIGSSPSFTNTATVLGAPSTNNPYGEAVDVFDPPYGAGQILSIGEGGSVTVKFKTPVLNHPRNPFGIDFIIFGNSGFIITNDFDFDTFSWVGTPATDGSLFAQNDGETRVSVSRDGKKFYVLNPAVAPTVDGVWPTDGSADPHQPLDPTLTSQDFAGATAEGIALLYGGSAGGAGYDISWAQDSQGRRVRLPEIRYVRVEVLSGKSEIDAFSSVFMPRGLVRGLGERSGLSR
jgi:hypothetical protein